MEYSLEIRPLATAEIIDAFNWYELQKEGLGLTFLEHLDVFVKNLISNPLSHSYYEKPVRQGVIYKFPYTVVYEVFESRIVIYSVFMDKQNPIKKRTK